MPAVFAATKMLDNEADRDAFKAIRKKVAKQVFGTANYVMLEGDQHVVMAGPQAYITMKANANIVFIQGHLMSPMDVLKFAKRMEIKPENLVLKYP